MHADNRSQVLNKTDLSWTFGKAVYLTLSISISQQKVKVLAHRRNVFLLAKKTKSCGKTLIAEKVWLANKQTRV